LAEFAKMPFYSCLKRDKKKSVFSSTEDQCSVVALMAIWQVKLSDSLANLK